MPKIKIIREMATKLKIERRIKANRIIGMLGFREHYSSHPDRHSWEICGHSVYWWVMKQMVETKYLEKFLLWTEDEEAKKIARNMSDKFVIFDRKVEECIEPMWKFMDDLKSNESRVNTIERWADRDKDIEELLSFKPTLFVFFQANQPMIRAKSITKLIERYFEDDIAEAAILAVKNYVNPSFFIQNPIYPEYLIKFGLGVEEFTTRQERPPTFTLVGPSIIPYKDKIHSMSKRMVYVEVDRDEISDIHNEEDLEWADFQMRKRIENERK